MELPIVTANETEKPTQHAACINEVSCHDHHADSMAPHEDIITSDEPLHLLSAVEEMLETSSAALSVEELKELDVLTLPTMDQEEKGTHETDALLLEIYNQSENMQETSAMEEAPELCQSVSIAAPEVEVKLSKKKPLEADVDEPVRANKRARLLKANSVVVSPTLSANSSSDAKDGSAIPELSLSACSNNLGQPEVVFSGPANTRSEYIKRLTSEEGQVECVNNAITLNQPDTSHTGRIDKEGMSKEEIAEEKRARNRIHARNTRLRRVVYREELKRTLMALAEERDAMKTNEWKKAALQKGNRRVRKKVLEKFLGLWGGDRYSSDANHWSAILMKDATLRLPVISPPDSDNSKDSSLEPHNKTLNGVYQMMEVSQAFSGILGRVAADNHREHQSSSTTARSLRFVTDDGTLLMDDKNHKALLEFHLKKGRNVNPMDNDNDELNSLFHGNLIATFDPDTNKIVSASMLFDTSPLKKMIRG